MNDLSSRGTAMANADRIRAMTDEELARWLNECQAKARLFGVWPKDAWLDWLKQVIYDLPPIKVNCVARTNGEV